MGYTYEHPRPAVTVDAVVFARERREDRAWRVLLVRRGKPPFEGKWALPGGFVEMDETLVASAARELAEETGLRGVALEQLHAFGDPGRDPRGRTVSVVHWGVVEGSLPEVEGDDDADEAVWHAVEALPELAFDHAEVLAMAIERLNERFA